MSLHIPVLSAQVTAHLLRSPIPIFADVTFGHGMHSKLILPHAQKLHASDTDPRVSTRIPQNPKIHYQNARFSAVKFPEKIGGAIMDLGIASDMVDEAGRGFSYNKDAELDMRFDDSKESKQITAKEICNTWTEDQLTYIIHHFGQDNYARVIAKRIVANRPINTTLQLVSIILTTKGDIKGIPRKHPATKTFQALRIAVNNELEELSAGLTNVCSQMVEGGKLAVITFHSLERNMVIERFPKAQLIHPTEEELAQNRRSRSAVLHAITIDGP